MKNLKKVYRICSSSSFSHSGIEYVWGIKSDVSYLDLDEWEHNFFDFLGSYSQCRTYALRKNFTDYSFMGSDSCHSICLFRFVDGENPVLVSSIPFWRSQSTDPFNGWYL